jgi:hypothetical protein
LQGRDEVVLGEDFEDPEDHVRVLAGAQILKDKMRYKRLVYDLVAPQSNHRRIYDSNIRTSETRLFLFSSSK